MTVKLVFAREPNLDRIVVAPLHSGRCHCGSVRFTVHFDGDSLEPYRCNCSICRRRGTVMAFVELAQFVIDRGEESLTCYQFNTRVAKHYFCSRCGIYTHHQRRSVPTQIAFNVGCLEGVDPLKLLRVPVIDGDLHHPSDASPALHAST